MRIAAVVLTSVLGLAGLAGCGLGSGDSAPGKDPAKSGKAKVVEPKSQMVAAFSSQTPPGPFDLRFQLAVRPAVGQPVDVRFAITPQKDIENLFVKFLPGDGLDVSRGGETERLTHPPIGVTIDHIV